MIKQGEKSGGMVVVGYNKPQEWLIFGCSAACVLFGLWKEQKSWLYPLQE